MDGTWITGLNDITPQGDTLMLGAFVALFLPGLLAIIQQTHWTSQVKGMVAFLMCIPVALLVAAATGKVTRESDVMNAVLIVISVTFVIYHTFWKPSGIAPAIEDKTTV